MRSSAGAPTKGRSFLDKHGLALQRLEAKQRVIADLIGGRLTLFEAAARFRRASGGGDGEALCRAVIGWAHLALSDRPERAEVFSEVLENELQAHLARHGVVLLPET
jgi:hypothetical protein